MKNILLLACLLLGGCSLFWEDAEDEYVYRPAYAISVDVAEVRDRTATFNYVGVPRSPCDEYVETQSDRKGQVIIVDLVFRYRKQSYCATVEPGPFEKEVAVRVREPGTYTFQFLSGPDETLDLEVVVP